MSKKLNRQIRRAFKKAGRAIYRDVVKPAAKDVLRPMKSFAKKQGKQLVKRGWSEIRKRAPSAGRFVGSLGRDVLAGALANTVG